MGRNTKVSDKVITTLLDKGKTHVEIAKITSCNVRTIRRRLDIMGIDRPDLRQKKISTRKSTNFSISPETKEKIELLALLLDKPMSGIVEDAVEEMYDRIQGEREGKK